MFRKTGIAIAALGYTTLSLQGCGGGSSGGDGTTTTTTSTTTLGPVPPQPSQDFWPIKGIGYQAQPKPPSSGPPAGPDMAQAGYEAMWHTKRDDLGIIHQTGSNAVRIYAGMGSELYNDHSKFLDRAQELGLNVIVDVLSKPALCPEFDCYDQWKFAVGTALKSQGFAKDGKWHPAVKMVMLLDQPDLPIFSDNTGASLQCDKVGDEDKPWCRIKGSLSALDGFLAAEAEAKIDGSDVKLGVTWSFSNTRTSADGKVVGGHLWGAQDMETSIKSPDLGGYSFQGDASAIQDAFSKRWVHSISAAGTSWAYFQEKVLQGYSYDRPLMVAELTYNPDSPEAFLTGFDEEAAKKNKFMGVVVLGFQTDYQGSGVSYMFDLGETKLGSVNVCREDAPDLTTKTCGDFDVFCLSPAKAGSAQLVATARQGSIGPSIGLCASSAETKDSTFVV
mmetsp:Transcript_42104/g.63592  ORF Transcript_42104/g.63592 Transcript_42104/m.63592 type:complete len:447 (-) Transcript_42104:253-1593(-)|eukprot:CAMPEP_0206449034 /NCGR_PEP_ID=MMETSP0324_2-20121206/17847_1 /ASSEMBLY_ACC=CAM_ASM_000836 /TAXON_ID=2866 /ORGANISM="Crypthecodinium cohnii, Strain Seligo" /LENGTH=446 /DNA_ID=CAMNT_0053918331 /DNA_START=74 /DNA_END=1414 /DNA_ORIENTATION=-